MQHNNRTPDDSTRRLARLDDLDDFEIADGEPDPRGWDVKTADGTKIGEVDSLVADTGAMEVRYLDVELDRKAMGLKEDRHVLVPIGTARMDDDEDEVRLLTATIAQLAAMPPYQPDEDMAYPATTPTSNDARDFYGKRNGTGAVKRLTLSEEQLRVGKRAKAAGHVDVKKTVETRHVEKQVPLVHEEVTVERRPYTGEALSPQEIAEGTVRVPLTAEEAVIEKRTVPVEEVVISKKGVVENETVKADVRKERVDTSDLGKHDGSADRNHGKSSR